MWVGFAFLLFGSLIQFQRQEIGRRAFLVRAALWGVCLWLTNQEYFVTTQIMVGLGFLFSAHAVVMGRRPKEEVRRVIVWYFVGLGITAAALAPLILWQISTPNQPFHPFSYINVYQVNLANLILPVHTALNPGWVQLTGNIMEQDGYFGIVALAGLITASIVVWRRTRGRYRLLIYWTLVLLVLAMGDFVIIDNAHKTAIPLPGIVLSLVPVLKDIIFDRFMWGCFWGIGLLISLYGNVLVRRSERLGLTLWAVLVVATWWPSGFPLFTLKPNPGITRAVQSGTIAAGSVVLVFPYDILFNPSNDVMYTQAANHFRYRLAEGYLSPNDAMLKHYDPLVTYLVAIQLYGPQSRYAKYLLRTTLHHPGWAFRQFLQETRPSTIVLTPMAHEAYMEGWLTRYLGRPARHSGSDYWWPQPRFH
jgi:hypothetical protein